MRVFRPPLRKFGRFGVLPANMGSGGQPNMLANDKTDLATRASCEFIAWLKSLPASGTVTTADDGRLRIAGAAVGTYTFGYAGWVMPLTGAPLALDGASGDPVITFNVTGAVADTVAPVMNAAGIAISSKTPTGFTSGVNEATDNVGVTGYRVSEDGEVTWIQKAMVRTHSHSALTPNTAYQVRWGARDAAGNWSVSDALTVTTDPVPAPTIITHPGGATVTEGATASLGAGATANGALTLQWFTRPNGDSGAGSAVIGATGALLVTSPLSLGQSGVQYRARARNTISGQTADAFTDWATVTVVPAGSAVGSFTSSRCKTKGGVYLPGVAVSYAFHPGATLNDYANLTPFPGEAGSGALDSQSRLTKPGHTLGTGLLLIRAGTSVFVEQVVVS